MQQPIFYIAGKTDALCHAKNRLEQWGYIFSPVPSSHVTHLLLPVPSFESPDILKGGQCFSDVLKLLPETITIFGGHLPQLPYRHADFLKDEYYLTENAAITAQCALQILHSKVPLSGHSVLLIGYGRISKFLLPLLQEQNAIVTVVVRREESLMQLRDSGEKAILLSDCAPSEYDVIINTAPAPLLHAHQCRSTAFLMDLASTKGIDGENVLWARGLPNRYSPEASGTLIAKTALRWIIGKEHL